MTDAPDTPIEAPQRAEPPPVIYLPGPSEPAPAPPKKARRGSENRHRPHLKQARLDDEERAAFDARARASGLTDGAYIRACTLGDPGMRARRQSRLPAIDAAALAHNTAALNRIGNNLNQMSRALNEIALAAGGGLPSVAHLTRPIDITLHDIRLAVAANLRAAGVDRQG